jgi:hypothetical protein
MLSQLPEGTRLEEVASALFWVKSHFALERAGAVADLGFEAHPHMLGHPAALRRSNKGHDTRALPAYLGNRNTLFVIQSCRRIGSRTSGDDRLSLSLNEYVAQARLYFRASVENQQAFDSGYSAASWSLQPHRHTSSGIRPTEQTSWLSSRLWRFKLDARVRQIKSESGAMHNVPNPGRVLEPALCSASSTTDGGCFSLIFDFQEVGLEDG